MKKISVKKRILFFSIIMVSFYIAIELLMFFLEPYLCTGIYMYDPDLGFRIRPGACSSNRFGFFDRDYPLERSPGKFRLLVLGDSYGWTCGLDKNYTNLLEEKYREYFSDDRVEVINSGYPMTHTGEQLAVLKKFGLQYNPDLVLLGFFVGNDFIDADPNRKRIVVNDLYLDIDRRDEIIFLNRPVIFRSRLFAFLQQKYVVLKEFMLSRNKPQDKTPLRGSLGAMSFPDPLAFLFQKEQKEEAQARKVEEVKPFFSDETFLGIEKSRLDFCNIHFQREGRFDDQIQYIFRSLAEMKELLASRNIDFVVAIYPDEFQVNHSLFQKLIERFDLKADDYDLTFMQDILKKQLNSSGVPFIDLMEEFRVRAENTRLYRPGDPHWNEEGNTLAAEILFDNISKVLGHEQPPKRIEEK